MTDENVSYIQLPETPVFASSFSAAEKAVLEEINRRVAAFESVEKIIDFIFSETRVLFPCDRIGLALVEEEGRRAVAYYVAADYQPLYLKKGYAEDMHSNSLAEVLRRRTPRLIRDLKQYLEEHPHSPSTRLIVHEGVRSSLTCPLVVEGRPVALFFRSARKPNAYSLRELQLHQAIVERLGQAIEKVSLIEKLREMNRAYLEMLGFVSHEVKNPVMAMMANASLVLEGYSGEANPAQKERMQNIVTKGEYLLNLVRQYLDLAQVEEGHLMPNFVPIKDFVKEAVEPSIQIVFPQSEVKNMVLEREFPGVPLAVSCDLGMVQIVLVNLIGNAVKYGHADGRVRVSVREEGDFVIISVWNEGPGFPESEKSRLFRKFSRILTPELSKAPGSGIGLYIAWHITRLHEGELTASSQPGAWAEFSLRLPKIPRPVSFRG
ncbi:MAG: GAF domain-containing sensor histidine kinase [Candidatus Omnitrophota bacterium]